MRERTPLPAFIRNAPVLQMGLELALAAFMELDTSRSVGMGLGPIPWSVINDWCRENQIHGAQREELIYHLRSMDAAYLKHYADKDAASRGK